MNRLEQQYTRRNNTHAFTRDARYINGEYVYRSTSPNAAQSAKSRKVKDAGVALKEKIGEKVKVKVEAAGRISEASQRWPLTAKACPA